jgi:hypothetical protein
LADERITTIKSPKATVKSQNDCSTDFMEEGAWREMMMMMMMTMIMMIMIMMTSLTIPTCE